MCYVLFSCDVQGLKHYEGSVQKLDHSFEMYHLCLFVSRAVKSDRDKRVSG